MEIKRVAWSLLSEFWCAPVEATDDDVVAAILESGAATGVDVAPGLIADRCVGGLACSEDTGRRHILFSTGHYTYLGENRALELEERRALVAEIVDANSDPVSGYIGGGPMTSDCPPRN